MYKLLDLLLASEDGNIYGEGQKAVVLLLEVNPAYEEVRKCLSKMEKLEEELTLDKEEKKEEISSWK